MRKQVLFIHGGGGQQDFEADALLVDSLRESLGESYAIHYPFLDDDDTSPDFGRKRQIREAISFVNDELILVGHSLGASMILKYLTESQVHKKITGIFLISAPFWSGDEEWKQGLKLKDDFADNLPQDVPVYLYHCLDDEDVPFDHLKLYAQHIPQAIICTIDSGGHQLNNDLSRVARDIISL